MPAARTVHGHSAAREAPAAPLDAGRAVEVRFQAPVLPTLAEIGRYYRMSEQARWYANNGPCARLLEHRLAAAVSPKARCVLVGNCTIGLLVALRAVAGVPDGRRRYVITPSFTFVATVDAVVWAGFEPLFVDVDPSTWQLEPGAVRAALEARGGEVAAVLGCSTFGTMPGAAHRIAVSLAAAAHGVPVLYDSAAAFGATDDVGRPSGSCGELEVYSFHATKPFAIGEGGAVVTTDDALAERVRSLANFGFDENRSVQAAGINAKLSELHAATGLAVLDGYESILERRRRMAAEAREVLEPFGWRFQEGAASSTVQFIPALAPDAATRDRALALGRDRGVEFRTYFEQPLHRAQPFRGFPSDGTLAVTDDLSRRILSLPMANDLSADDLDRVLGCCVDAAVLGG